MAPPGLKEHSNLSECTQEGGHGEWMDYNRIKMYTNAFIIKDGKLLLGYKKRGFGQSRYNGFGGKVEPGETSEDAAKRELEEEAGIQAPLEHAGTLFFVTEGLDWAFNIEIYRAEEFSGSVIETEEMRPAWFSILDSGDAPTSDPPIPYDNMWDSDRFWLPHLLANRKFRGRTDFAKDGENFTLRKWWFGAVDKQDSNNH